MTPEYVVDVKDLSKSFNGKPAVSSVSLQVKRGEIFGFLGPNGSGKTTTIRMLCGLLTPDAGIGTCLGYNIVRESDKIKPLVGYVPQTFSLYQDLTVYENLEFIARVYRVENFRERIHDLMHELELDRYQKIFAGKLSGGWKQRLSLASALIHDPKLLLLDEPTAGVDPKARRDFWEYIAKLTTRGITSLVSTHYMDEAERCNRLAYIVYGRLMVEGTISDIIKHVQLISYLVHGKDLPRLNEALRHEAAVEQVIAWGNELRVCGTQENALLEVIKRYPEYVWKATTTSLEEVFIHLVTERSADAR